MQIQRLLKNWGESADSLQCKAEIRLYDAESGWECFIYAINTDDLNEIKCIIHAESLEICDWTIEELKNCYNYCGDAPTIDYDFVPRECNEIIRSLKEKYGY